MLEILISFIGGLREIGLALDAVAFTLIDNAYDLIVTFSEGTLFDGTTLTKVMNNLYIIIAIFALFRVALLLVNAIISPDKLMDKEAGLGKILTNTIIMFVLLILTPILFDEAINIQETIVKENYIQRLFLDVGEPDPKTGKYSIDNPGKGMRSIAISALITIPDEVAEMRENKEAGCGDGSGKPCDKAITAYNQMKEENDFSFKTLGKHIATKVKDNDGNEIFVYDYLFFVSFFVGIAITYVLLSFAIDIAVRMVELSVLKILSPIFIATYIDPKSAKSGAFHKWLQTVGKTYASLFIKLAILSIMLMLLGLLNEVDLPDNGNWVFTKLLLLFAVLIFAKKAPKWIGGMIGVDGEGSGLGGLGIAKKLGGAALIGGATSKALSGAARGAARGAAGMGLSYAKRTHAARKANKLKNKEEGKTHRAKAMNAYRDSRTTNGRLKSLGAGAKSFFTFQPKQDLENMGKNFKAGFKGGLQGAVTGASLGWKAKDLKDVNAQTSADSKAYLKKYAPGYETMSTRAQNWADRKLQTSVEKELGDPEERRKDAGKMKVATEMRTTKPVINPDGSRNKIQSWQGYEEFKTSIGSDVLTENGAFIKDATNNGYTYNSTSGTLEKSGKSITVEEYKKETFTEAGRNDLAAYVAKNVQSQNDTLKLYTETRTANDQKIAEFNVQVAQLARHPSTPETAAAITSLNSQIRQLTQQNAQINVVNTDLMNNMINTEKEYSSNPKDCPGTVQKGDDYYTSIGKFTYDPTTRTYTYELQDTSVGTVATGIVSPEKFVINPIVQNEISNKLAEDATKKQDKADKSHAAMNPDKK